jgi:hypothetical protein
MDATPVSGRLRRRARASGGFDSGLSRFEMLVAMLARSPRGVGTLANTTLGLAPRGTPRRQKAPARFAVRSAARPVAADRARIAHGESGPRPTSAGAGGSWIGAAGNAQPNASPRPLR